MASDLPVNKLDFEDWWVSTCEKDRELYFTKAKEYGSLDLEMIGSMIQSFIEIKPIQAGIETGIAFYAYGKLARIFSAYRDGRIPSEDTLKDLCIYAMMLRAARAGYIP